mmetsp:Transcript_5420/g.10659  ORF Transcript_5420/g.10659 Transcript_5420/m.10659 type:complete len:180 (+) Transcript_5420:121-660(+)|eukprot:CAMPEP_0119070052 /NCGR_PEP_ID=MMETSP1178-20130426/33375_1 /TAXON_ID=33656 /ORGANISM="unid sp, Strain CCMP2000" /LENGTH=179 /DNA_ID=CAMNT_0007051861 /DNA_START=121 /DNA_END=660 /DNA_ORIENTATION=+
MTEKKTKTFDMPGQTKELDMSTANSASSEASLIFYETLHAQRPDSEMAIRWLLQHGKLPLDEAKLWSKKLGKDKKTTAVAASSKQKLKADDDDFAKRPAAKKAKKAVKPEPDSSDDDADDFKKPKPAPKKPAAKKPAAKPAPKKPAPKPKVKHDDSSSDEEDRPLSQRATVAADDSSED